MSPSLEQLKTAERSELFREGLRRLEQEDRQRQQAGNLGDLGAVFRAIQQSATAAGLDKMSSRPPAGTCGPALRNQPLTNAADD